MGASDRGQNEDISWYAMRPMRWAPARLMRSPANKFTTITAGRNGSPYNDQVVVKPDHRLASTLHAAAPQTRLPAGYWVPVQLTIGDPLLKGPYYLRVASKGPRLLNTDPLYASTDRGNPWVRIYADSFNTATGKLTVASSPEPQMSANPSWFSRFATLTAILVFDHPPAASDLSFELESAPDGVDVYSPATGKW
jgi:hypothetical protein